MHVLLALSLLAIPGLMGLCLLMEWLEQTFAGRYAGDDIRRVLDEELPPEHVEALDSLRKLAHEGTVTLLTASKRDDISEATVLQQVLNGAA